MARKGKTTHMKNRVRNYIVNGINYGYGGYGCYGGYGGFDNYDDPYYDYWNAYGVTGGGKGAARTSSYVTRSITPTVLIEDLGTVVENPTDALVRKMAAQRMKVYETYQDALNDENRLEDCYFHTKDGWGVLRTRVVDGNKVMFIDSAKECPLYKDPPKAVGIDIVNKIPKELLKEVFHSFFAVYKKYHKEAAAQIWRKKDGDREYFVVYPEQNISGASVSFQNDTEEMAKIREIADRVVDCHSHHSMGAFWSGVDDNDEKTADCFRMVMGAMSSTKASYLLRIKYGDVYVNFSATKLFDMTQEEEDEIFTTTTIEVDKIETKIFDHILDKVKAAGVTTTSSASWKRKDEDDDKESFMKVLATAPDVIMASSYLSRKLWYHSQFDRDLKVYSSCGYLFYPPDKVTKAAACWKRKEVENKSTVESAQKPIALPPTASTENTTDVEKEAKVIASEDVDDMEEKVLASKRMLDYIAAIGAVFCGGKVSSTEVNPQPEGAKVVDYLCGCTEYTNGGSNIDADSNSNSELTLPGEVGIKHLVGNGDEFETNNIDKVTYMQAIARMKAQENIEESLDFYGGKSMRIDSSVLTEEEQDYIYNVLKNADELNFSKSFSPSVMWELLTNAEKCKLAAFFGVTVVELGTAFGYAAGHGFENKEPMQYMTALLLYRIILMPEDITCTLMSWVNKEVVDANTPHTIIIKLNEYVKNTFEDKQEK